jgi:hypothetical protein
VSARIAAEWRKMFRREAGRIWREQGRAERHGLVLNEETITETALVQISDKVDRQHLRVHAYNKRTERKTGADWEWVIYRGGQFVRFRIQAKRLFADGTYRSLNPRGAQTRTLIAQAKRWQAIPAFVFYNGKVGVDASGITALRGGCKCEAFKGRSFWGATIARAEHVREVGQKQFASLKPAMLPWHCMMCQLLNSDLFNLGTKVALSGKSTGLPEQVAELPPIEWQFDTDGQYAEFHSKPGRWHEEYLAHRALAGVVLFEVTPEGSEAASTS